MSDYLALNRANWDERVAIHLAATESYDLTPLREGRARLHPIEASELGDVAGLRLLHPQCHFGRDTLTLARQGAEVTGIDFSPAAIEAARALAAELALPARFVLSDVYSAAEALPEPASFDRVFVTWGAIHWLPDMARWARMVAYFLRPGGRLYLADAHPTSFVFDDMAPGLDGRPGWLVPYFSREAVVIDDARDYADPNARLVNTRTHSFQHTLADILGALSEAGLILEWLHEHPTVPWRMFRCLVPLGEDMFGWPDRPWLPLSFSLSARRA
jgi:SAM-dependent methyltransferase